MRWDFIQKRFPQRRFVILSVLAILSAGCGALNAPIEVRRDAALRFTDQEAYRLLLPDRGGLWAITGSQLIAWREGDRRVWRDRRRLPPGAPTQLIVIPAQEVSAPNAPPSGSPPAPASPSPSSPSPPPTQTAPGSAELGIQAIQSATLRLGLESDEVELSLEVEGEEDEISLEIEGEEDEISLEIEEGEGGGEESSEQRRPKRRRRRRVFRRARRAPPTPPAYQRLLLATSEGLYTATPAGPWVKLGEGKALLTESVESPEGEALERPINTFWYAASGKIGTLTLEGTAAPTLTPMYQSASPRQLLRTSSGQLWVVDQAGKLYLIDHGQLTRHGLDSGLCADRVALISTRGERVLARCGADGEGAVALFQGGRWRRFEGSGLPPNFKPQPGKLGWIYRNRGRWWTLRIAEDGVLSAEAIAGGAQSLAPLDRRESAAAASPTAVTTPSASSAEDSPVLVLSSGAEPASPAAPEGDQGQSERAPVDAAESGGAQSSPRTSSETPPAAKSPHRSAAADEAVEAGRAAPKTGASPNQELGPPPAALSDAAPFLPEETATIEASLYRQPLALSDPLADRVAHWQSSAKGAGELLWSADGLGVVALIGGERRRYQTGSLRFRRDVRGLSLSPAGEVGLVDDGVGFLHDGERARRWRPEAPALLLSFVQCGAKRLALSMVPPSADRPLMLQVQPLEGPAQQIQLPPFERPARGFPSVSASFCEANGAISASLFWGHGLRRRAIGVLSLSADRKRLILLRPRAQNATAEGDSFLPEAKINGFSADAQGRLYLASDSGLVVLKNGELEEIFDENRGEFRVSQVINDLAVDPLGAVWLATPSGIGLLKDQRARLLIRTKGLQSGATAITRDQSGQIWFAFDDQLWRGRPGEWRSIRLGGIARIGTIRQLRVIDEKRVWIGSSEGLFLLKL